MRHSANHKIIGGLNIYILMASIRTTLATEPSRMFGWQLYHKWRAFFSRRMMFSADVL